MQATPKDPGKVAPRRKRKRILVTTIFSLGATLTLLILVLQCRPSWYQPVVLSESVVQDARRETVAAADDFSDRLVRRKLFEVVFTEDEVTRWLAALPQVWPEAGAAWPKSLQAPVVRFVADGQVYLGVRAESSGWRAVVSLEGSLKLSENKDSLRIKLDRIQCGKLSIPATLLEQIAPWVRPKPRPQAGKEGSEGQGDPTTIDVAQLVRGVEIGNTFVWPNGRRKFRITALHVENGRVRLTIQPL